MILRARVVLPLRRPAIRNGAVVVDRNRIAAVGQWRDLAPQAGQRRVIDLGDAVLMPGLVNAHCHLDYTHMAGQLPPPKVFTEWLKVITATKAGWSLADFAASWREGASMLVRTGTTTVGDIEAVPQLLPDAWRDTPLRVISFLEMIGITSRRSPRVVLDETLPQARALRSPRNRVGLSPHAPYSTVPDLLRATARIARRKRWRVATHVAESSLEFDMYMRGEGEMFEWIRRSGRDMSDCGQGSPVRQLERCGLLRDNLLAIHVNYLARGDADLLRTHRVHVVHCPRSHHYFRHEAFPLRRLLRAGVNVCLGTDSLASVWKTRREDVELSMFDEMRALAAREPGLRPRRILEMATVNAADALGLAGQAGELSPGAHADMIALGLAGEARSLPEAILNYRGEVRASLIDGRWARKPEL